ncbi:MAG: methyltransferase domain-containing protein [Thermoplasmatales archaeon]|nr:methyltransferase domain-containing protein [Thermoplasmatales archaeon]
MPDESIDIVLLYDVIQMIRDKEKLLQELHWVLKPDASLFATSEHLDVNEFMNILTKEKLFILVSEKGKLFKFRRN